MQKITPFLFFTDQAEDAMKFYTSIFKNSKVLGVMPGEGGKAMGVSFELEGTEFKGLNGGPHAFDFNEAISFFIDCDGQEEVDYYWNKLSEGGKTNVCGWLQDQFGVRWQVVPRQMGEMFSSPDREAAMRAMNAMMKMTKLDIAGLKKAFEGK